MRLIDANLLRDKTVWAERHTATGNVCKLVVEVADIEKLPTIDAVPVIRCKDCSFWGTEQDGYCAAIDDPYMLETDAEDFCSWGKKK